MRRKERKEAKIGIFDEDDKTRKKAPVYPPLEFPEVDKNDLEKIKKEIKETALSEDKKLLYGFLITLFVAIIIITALIVF